ncbi:ClpP/crotonase-like domain-containing protein [Terfezia claveryi]|nr:ClpP/crotonase-like domain-containing protein [Terfezia claveryi]
MPTTTPSDPILLTLSGPIAIITLNLPHKLNALSSEAYQHLAHLLRKVADMTDITITLLTGTGRFFSAGADVGSVDSANVPAGNSPRTFWLQRFSVCNIDVTKSFLTHPKLLIAALNGPAIGLSAALIAHCDFIYATSSTYLLTPFTSLGLVAEGGASYTFVRRLGLAKANEALILSKPLPAADLLACGFLNKIYPAPADPRDCSSFHKAVLEDVRSEFLERGLNRESMLLVKKLIRGAWEEKLECVNVKEAFMGVERFLSGAPKEEFRNMARGEKKHKL